MKKACNSFIERAMGLAQELVLLADEGEAVSEDNSCVLLFGIVRDCAYRVRRQAQGERERRRLLGLWEDRDDRMASREEPPSRREGLR